MTMTFSEKVRSVASAISRRVSSDISGSVPALAATGLSRDELPADEIVFVPMTVELAQVCKRDGMYAGGAFFTFLPVAFSDPVDAQAVCDQTEGETCILSVDTSLFDISNWTPDSTVAGKFVVWGSVPPQALADYLPTISQGYSPA